MSSIVGKNPNQTDTIFSTKADEIIQRWEPWISPEGNINLMGKSIPGKHFTNYWPKPILDRLQKVRQEYGS